MQLGLELERDRSVIAYAGEKKGVVYTREWVVDLILDLAGYCSTNEIVSRYAVEPAAGEGAFFLPMIRRLLEAWRLTGLTADSLRGSLRAYEIDGDSAHALKVAAVGELVGAGIHGQKATEIADGWVAMGDYLLESPSDEGADFVIGNPPYIRYDDLPDALLTTYRRMYTTMRGRCDIYIAFYEAALAQLKPNGVCAFICADRWMRSAYGSELRRLIGQRANVEAVIEMHSAPAFEEDVSAYPAVTVLRRSKQRSVLVASAGTAAGSLRDGDNLAHAVTELASRKRTSVPGFNATQLPGWYTGEGPWPWAEPGVLALLQQLEATCRSLEDPATGTKVGIGVATGADKVFITTDSTIVEPDRLLPLAMGADTRTGTLTWSGHYLIDPWLPDGQLVELQQYPKLSAYYHRHVEALHHRHVVERDSRGWYRTIDRVNHALWHREKLYFPDMKVNTHPVLDRGETYPHHNLYFIVSDAWDLEVLGGLLLSKIAEIFVASYCVKMRGGTLRFQAQYLRRIRVPDVRTIAPPIQFRLREAFMHHDRHAATEAALAAYGVSALPSDL